MMAHVRNIFLSSNIPVDFEEIELSSKDPSNEVLEHAIIAIERNGLAIKVYILKASHNCPTCLGKH